MDGLKNYPPYNHSNQMVPVLIGEIWQAWLTLPSLRATVHQHELFVILPTGLFEMARVTLLLVTYMLGNTINEGRVVRRLENVLDPERF